MSFSDDNNLEIPTSGVADWDSPLNSNFTSLARGFEFKATAGLAVNTGDAVSLVSSGFVMPYDAASLDAPSPVGVARTSLGSGDAGQFMMQGVIRSLDIWSGNIVAGERVFVDVASIGYLTASYDAARYAIGWAVDVNAVMVSPHVFLPEPVTDTQSFALSVASHATVGSAENFTFRLGRQGYMRRLRVITDSMDAYRVQFWSGSSRVSSELLFETLTTSVDGGAADFDIQSLHWVEGASFPYWSTDAASHGLIYGTITAQSVSAVGSSNFSVTLWGDRFA